MIVISLPRIDGLDLEKAGKDHPDVSEFMKRGYISSFKHLKSINKLAPHIYGNIISARAGKKKIVFVIDSWATKSPFRRAGVRALSTYVKQISASYRD